MITALAGSLPLATNNFGDTESNGVVGPMGLLIIVLLAIATVFLIRNMNARIKRLPERFDHETGSGHDSESRRSEHKSPQTRND